jgi:hypothetical protein
MLSLALLTAIRGGKGLVAIAADQTPRAGGVGVLFVAFGTRLVDRVVGKEYFGHGRGRSSQSGLGEGRRLVLSALCIPDAVPQQPGFVALIVFGNLLV